MDHVDNLRVIQSRRTQAGHVRRPERDRRRRQRDRGGNDRIPALPQIGTNALIQQPPHILRPLRKRRGMTGMYRSTVDTAVVTGRRRRRQFTRHLGRGGGVVDENRPFLHRFEGAVRTCRHRTQIVIIADAGKDEILALGRLRRRYSEAAAVLANPLLGFRFGAVVDGDVVAALVPEVPGHWIAHHAKTEKCHRCHKLALQNENGICCASSRLCAQFVKTRAG